MSNTTESTAIEALSENVLSTRFENLDKETIENARNRIIDVLGCAIGGAEAPGNRALVEIIKDISGKPEASILVWVARYQHPTLLW